MITKIKKIKNLGIFDDFTWASDLPDFKQYNVIYGWNGSGKTTLSKLANALSAGNHHEFDALEYTIEDKEGTSTSQGSVFNTPIRVFNRDYIAGNVDFETLSSKTIVVVLGEENQEILQAINSDEKKLVEINTEITAKSTERRTKETVRNTAFTDIARTISQGTQGAIVRNYNKTNAETAFRAMTDKELLEESDVSTLSKSVAQDSMQKQGLLSIGDSTNELVTAVAQAKKLLGKTVEAAVIGRLKENADISSWVEEGLALHNKHKGEKCEFCGNPITAGRLTELAAHFNEADAKLKAEVDKLVEELRPLYTAIQALQPVDKMNLYQEYRDEYGVKALEFTAERDLLLTAITEFAERLKSKKAHTTEVITLQNEPSLDKLSAIAEALNTILNNHNTKTDNFDAQRKANSQKIERHYLSTIYDNIKALDTDITNLAAALKTLDEGVEGDDENIGKKKLEARITANKAKISSSHRACELLNDSLKKFLGHDEIKFDPNDDNTGYRILRRDHPATNLSEGERTAIAFVFFVTQLKDQNFNPESGIIVIDDPISSLDSNSQFQAFSFLKTATAKASQLFLLTHNFDFLKLLLNWVKGSRTRGGYALYMIKNRFSLADGSRSAYLDKLDPSLEKFESEYHYLFNILYAYKDDGTIENAYKIPNIARKLLDNFLMFCVPKNENTYNRLQELDFDEEKKTALYKFVNDQSHITGAGFDPSLVPEAQKCIAYLFELMEVTFPSHYKYLKETVS